MRAMKGIRLFFVLVPGFLWVTATAQSSAEDCGTEARACVQYGARIFQQRCTLCHGSDGMGEGILPLALKGYPPTNLMDPTHAFTREELRHVIRYGGGLPRVSIKMPPWGDELTESQLESVVLFVEVMRRDQRFALSMLRRVSRHAEPSLRLGRGIFKGRCSLCHGNHGEGDGRMTALIHNPPPFNLTLSDAPDAYLSNIIHRGGQAMGRSYQMPPFGGDLSENEINSVILFIKTLRKGQGPASNQKRTH